MACWDIRKLRKRCEGEAYCHENMGGEKSQRHQNILDENRLRRKRERKRQRYKIVTH